jgi:hypothetical protein
MKYILTLSKTKIIFFYHQAPTARRVETERGLKSTP